VAGEDTGHCYLEDKGSGLSKAAVILSKTIFLFKLFKPRTVNTQALMKGACIKGFAPISIYY
jgi:hypothetical protein